MNHVYLWCDGMLHVINIWQFLPIVCLLTMSWRCVCIILILSSNSLSDIRWNDANPSDFMCVYTSSMLQYNMVSMILSASHERPSSDLAENWFVGGFFFYNSLWTLGLNSITLRMTTNESKGRRWFYGRYRFRMLNKCCERCFYGMSWCTEYVYDILSKTRILSLKWVWVYFTWRGVVHNKYPWCWRVHSQCGDN